MEATVLGKDAVFEAHAQNRAISSLLAALPDSIQDAKFDRDELTLTIARDQIRAAVTVALDSSFNRIVDQITENVLAALSAPARRSTASKAASAK